MPANRTEFKKAEWHWLAEPNWIEFSYYQEERVFLHSSNHDEGIILYTIISDLSFVVNTKNVFVCVSLALSLKQYIWRKHAVGDINGNYAVPVATSERVL